MLFRSPTDVDAAYKSDDEKETMMDDGERIEADPDDPNVGPATSEPSDE